MKLHMYVRLDLITRIRSFYGQSFLEGSNTNIMIKSCLLLAIVGIATSDEYVNHVVLDKDGKFDLFWTANEEDIVFEIQVS